MWNGNDGYIRAYQVSFADPNSYDNNMYCANDDKVYVTLTTATPLISDWTGNFQNT